MVAKKENNNHEIYEQILKNCSVIVANSVDLDPDAFTQARRCGLGASDASVILGLQSAWRTPDSVVEDKLRTEVTEAEREIGKKPSVRKGRELEPLILSKAADFLQTDVIKPPHMYQIKEYPYLTIDYDGVSMLNKNVIPVEAKYVTSYGTKYYAPKQAIDAEDIAYRAEQLAEAWFFRGCIETRAKECGVPAYYYAQVQQQMLGTKAPYGLLVALFETTWDLKCFVIPRDEAVQERIITEGYKTWSKVEKLRGK